MHRHIASLFISYSSSSSDFARRLAEILKLNGIPTWFAEYDIDPDLYLRDSWDEIAGKIEMAINECSHAILLINKSWHASDACQMEWKLLHQRLRNTPERMIELAVPHESDLSPCITPIESGVAAMGADQDMARAIQSIGQQFGIKLRLPSSMVVRSKYRNIVGISRRMDSVVIDCSTLLPHDAGYMRVLTGSIEGSEVHLGVLYFLPNRTTGNPLRHASDRQLRSIRHIDPSPKASVYSRERIEYRDHLARAHFVCRTRNMNILGGHLYHRGNGASARTEFACTVFDKDAHPRMCVMRIYCASLTSPNKTSSGEIVLLASTTCKSDSPRSSLCSLWEVAPRLDEIVDSIRWDAKFASQVRMRWKFRIAVVAFLSVTLILTAGAVGSVLAGSRPEGFKLAGCSAIIGLIVVGFAHWVAKRSGLIPRIEYELQEVEMHTESVETR